MTPPEPARPGPEVWLTDAAIEDLHRLDGAPLVWALKKMLLLETDPYAGEPLVGRLVGYRKLVVGNRDWRLVWRVITDERGAVIIDVAEVWAVGARTDAAVYEEMVTRVDELPDGRVRRSLADVVEQLGKRAKSLRARPPFTPPARVQGWLVERLVHTAGMDRSAVEAMTSEQAVDAWVEYRMHST